ncbi:MAG: hypothetical protein AAF290_15765 [Pseudomonadota bacterium]
MNLVLTVAVLMAFVALAVTGLRALSDRRAGMAVLCLFALFYLHIRPLMLLTGTNTLYAPLHAIQRKLEPGDLLPVMSFIWLCLLLAFLGYSMIMRRPRAAQGVSPTSSSVYAVLLQVCLVCTAILFLFSSVFQAFGLLFGAALVGFVSCLLVASRSRWRWMAAIVGLCGIALLLQFTIERRDFAVALLSLLFVMALSHQRRLATVLLAGTVLVSAGLIVAVWLRTPDAIAIGDVLARLTGSTFVAVIEIELDFAIVFDDIVILMQEVPQNTAYLGGETFLKPFLSFVPRALWEGKPETISRLFSLVFNRPFYDAGGSQPITLIGELYWNLGWAGSLAMLPFGMLLGGLDRSTRDLVWRPRATWLPLERFAVAKYIVLSAMVFYLLRGPTDTVWMSFLWIWLLWRVALVMGHAVLQIRHGEAGA